MYYKLTKTKLCCQALLIGLFLVYPVFCLAAAGDVLINEIAWMGNENSFNDEWLELKNTTGQNIDLTGWTLTAIDGTPNISLSGTIVANGYFLLERTDDTSVPNVIADQIYTGNLDNDGENLTLEDDQNSSIDSIDASGGWLFGDKTTKQTMEWNGSTWQTSQAAGGTPKAENSILSQQTTPSTDISSPTNTSSSDFTNHPPFAVAGLNITALTNQEISFDASESYDMNNDPITYFWNFGDGATDIEEQTNHTYTYPGQYLVSLLVSDGTFSDLDIITVNIYERSVIINEFSNQWIELYNQSDQTANLTGWQLNDFMFPPNSFIGPKQFLILRQEITKIDFSSSNQISLIYPDGSVGTEVSYLVENKEGFSIAFDGNDYFWTKVPTPGLANIISATSITNKSEIFSANNPKPIIEQTNMVPIEDFISQESPTSSTQFMETTSQTPQNNPQNPQTAAISQKTSPKQTTLIFYLFIIIAASLIFSWVVIRVRNSRRV